MSDERTQSPTDEDAYTQDEYYTVNRISNCTDYYEILNVPKNATDSHLKKAYHRLALQLHPDKCRAPGATDAFKALGHSYAVLSDEQKRKQYDIYGDETVSAQVVRHRGRFEPEFTAEAAEEIYKKFMAAYYPTSDNHITQIDKFPYGMIIALIALVIVFTILHQYDMSVILARLF